MSDSPQEKRYLISITKHCIQVVSRVAEQRKT